MSMFRTSTPAYRGQAKPAQPSRTFGEWLRSLFCVETPRYLTKPVFGVTCEPKPVTGATCEPKPVTGATCEPKPVTGATCELEPVIEPSCESEPQADNDGPPVLSSPDLCD